ncbi:unnamed protein product [Euphydryas editha]|uniref:B box-type domain-containing protein n=1 Tax=Euphydryas editha TaxID=104508 RepID=A0AAU9V0J6_EUPED|nr:unnamed protein product [Euphydryas editha]
MEVDRILYIFGSFSRKRQERRKSLEPSSISAGNSPLKCKNSRPASQNVSIARTSVYEKIKLKDWECGICRRELVEPRLLGCLHSFCTRCLQGLNHEDEIEVWEDIDGGSIHHDPGGSGGGSAGSGYESDLHHSDSETSLEKPPKYGIITRKVSGRSCHFVICPTCGTDTQLPLGGVSALPLNYVLLRKMANGVGDNSVLCDLCCTDNKAENRCTQCLVSVCMSCGETHTKQKGNATHFLQPLGPILRFCGQHPKIELSVYCATCQQVVCRDCCLISHSGHAVASAARAAAERAGALRDACERARHVPGNVQRAHRILEVHAAEVDTQAARVESEIRTWSEQYRRAVEAHARSLAGAAVRARAAQRRRARHQATQLDRRAAHALEAVQFTEELLSSGKEEELLSLSAPVLRRLERLTELTPLAEPPRCELRFSPAAPAPDRPTLVGRLFTLAPDPDRCVLDTEGLQDLHVNVQHTVILELRDSNSEKIWYSGENVAGYFRRRDSSARPAAVRVRARADGSCALALAPPAPGHYLLAVTVDNTPIKGSPFSCSARAAAHWGTFHCCAFCSSGGRRPCGCGAAVAGHKGCGHGHAGWPGARHWSCCGSTRREPPCARAARPLYQFSL